MALTHVWDMRLLTELPRHLDEIEREITPGLGRAPRYWLAAFFLEEDGNDSAAQVAAAEVRCVGAAYHYALLHGGPLARPWCCYEAACRIWSAMEKLGLGLLEDLIHHIVGRHPAFPRLIGVEGIADIWKEVGGGGEYDRLGAMAARHPKDVTAIRARIAERRGSPAEFNMIMSAFRAAALRAVYKVGCGRAQSRCARWCRMLG